MKRLALFALVLFAPVFIFAFADGMDAPATDYVETGKTVGAVWLLFQALGTVFSLFPKHTIVGRIGQWMVTFPGQFTPGGPYLRR